MARLTWDQTSERQYETGVDHAVLYPGNGKGVVWNGIISINESSSGAEPTAIYADNTKYLNLLSAEEFSATVEAYSYPPALKRSLGEVDLLNGVTVAQQTRHPFGLCYRTQIGNDQNGSDHGYKLHLIYHCMAAPTERAYSTVNDTPEAVTLSWEITTSPVPVEGHKPTATVVMDSTKFYADGLVNVLRSIEDALYGTDTSDARILYITDIQFLFRTGMYLLDDESEQLLDSSENPIRSQIFS